jgi:hypothetical protein
MVAVMAGALLALVLTGCGPTGGTVTLVNESSYLLKSPTISLGDGNEDQLAPGGSMKSIVDKDVAGARVKFSLDGGDGKVTISRSGSWFLGTWSSSLISVQNGDSVVVTVRNKTE